LRSSQIKSLLAQNSSHILRRLQLLYHHGFLERPRAQLDYYHQGGSREIVYGLGNKGEALLKKKSGTLVQQLRWGEKSRSVGRLFLEHALLVSDIMVSLELACRAAGNVRLLQGEDVPFWGKNHRRPLSLKWYVKLNNPVKLGVIPDRILALDSADKSEDRNPSFFFLEADRGTMPVIRKNLEQTSFYRKLLAYEATWAQGIHRSKFGFNRFRVIAVTKSPARVKSLVEACSKLKTGHGLFLFSDEASLKAHGNILTMQWQTGRPGETATLLD
jgi:hypothetical protein